VTDRQTEGQTDRILPAIPRLHYMQHGKKYAMWQPYNLKAACLNFGMWGRVLDVINHAKF